MSNYTLRYNKEKNVIHLGGAITSECSVSLENEILNLVRNTNPSELLIIDVKELEYTSSTGLRIFLKIAKEHHNFKIVNANESVYHVLEMTGFTNILKVVPQLREISVKDLKLIGEGFVGSVYRLDNDKIIKVYKHISSVEDIFRERDLAKKVFELGLPTALSYEVVKIKEGGFGSIFELVNSDPLNKIIANDIEHADKYLEEYAKLIKQIVTTPVLDNKLPNKKNNLDSAIETIEKYHVLEMSEISKLRYLVDTMPESHTLIHGDCHLKNIMVQDGEYMLIDMDTVGYGSPYFELAGIYQTYVCYPQITPGDLVNFLGIPDELGVKAYEKMFNCVYGELSIDKQKEISNKIRLIAYIFMLRRTLVFERDNEKKMSYSLNSLKKQLEIVNSLE